MFMGTMLNLLLKYRDNMADVSKSISEHPEVFTVSSSILTWKDVQYPDGCSRVFSIGNFLLYPCYVKGNHLHRGLVVTVCVDDDPPFEVYGAVKFVNPYKQGASLIRALMPCYTKYGWKAKGPWVEDLQDIMKQLKMELDFSDHLRRQKSKEAAVRENLKQIKLQQERLENFTSRYNERR